MLDIIFYIIIPLFVLIVIFILWFKYGKDEKIIKKISKYPPKLNNILFGYYYKGNINENDIKATIVSLSIRGYIKIIKKQKKHKIEVIKNYNEIDELEKNLLDNLVNKDLSDKNILLVTNKIKESLIITNDINKVFEEESLSKKTCCKFLIFITYLIIVIKALIYVSNLKSLILLLILNLIGAKIIVNLSLNKKLQYNLLSCALGILMIILPLMILIINNISGIYKLQFIISLLLLCLMLILFIIMPKRTKKSSKILNEILGFKLYVENLDDIDEKYYYEVLPYILNLNLYKSWMNKYNIPKWYEEI